MNAEFVAIVFKFVRRFLQIASAQQERMPKYSHRVMPIGCFTSGCGIGMYGIDFIALTSSVRKFAHQRWQRNK
jgi:hypothetical protein